MINKEGTRADQFPVYDEYVRRTLSRREGEFTEVEEVEILVLTWNLHNQFVPKGDYRLAQKVFGLDKGIKADIVFVALQ